LARGRLKLCAVAALVLAVAAALAIALLGAWAAPPVDLKFNFAPAGAPVPAGYAAETGQAFSATTGYGWVRRDSLGPGAHVGLNVSSTARDRNAVADQRLDTFIHMEHGSLPPAAWEVAVPDGSYTVTVAVGDASYTDSIHRINLEGVAAISNFTPTTSNRFLTVTRTVTVADGRLTVDSAGGQNTKLDYIEIQSVENAPPAPPSDVTATPGDRSVTLGWQANTEPDFAGYNVYRSTSLPVDTTGAPLNGATPLTVPTYTDSNLSAGTEYNYVVQAVDTAGNRSNAPPVSATPEGVNPGPVDRRIDFQPATSPLPAGYVADIGLPYANARGFGWVRADSLTSATHVGLDVSGNARDRNEPVDDRLDTFIHMQYGGSASGSVTTPAAWELRVADGAYTVTVAVGDASYTDSTHRINIEGTAAIPGFAPTSAKRFETVTRTVSVSDGKLTLDAIGGQNTKIGYVDIRSVEVAPPAPPSGVSATPGDRSITVTWQPNAEPDLAGYNVYRGTSLPVDTAGTPLNGGAPLTGTSYADTGLTVGTEYFYVVQAVDTAGNRAAADPVSGVADGFDPGPVDRKINFQPAGVPVPAGYTADVGLPFSVARGFGWVRQDSLGPGSHVGLDVSANARDRNLVGDQRLDTFIHMQYTGTAPGSVTTPAAWEVRVPNGAYDVTVGVGDADGIDSVHRINIEGQTTIAGFVPTSQSRFANASRTVNVTDGRITLDSIGGANTKLDFVKIATASAGPRPSVRFSTPADGAAEVPRDTSVTAEVLLPTVGGGIDPNTLTEETVRLERVTDGAPVPAVRNTSGGGDVIVLQPTVLLEPTTQYRLEVTSGLKDVAGAAFMPYASTFTTRATAPAGSGSPAKFEKVALPTADGKMFTSLAIGPDGKLYAATLEGEIVRFALNGDGTTGSAQVITSLQEAEGGPRHALGLAFDPAATASNPMLWVSHSEFAFADANDWTGKITRLSGPNLETVRDFVTGLPRSFRDHETNSLAFGPDGALYVSQGSNTATGAPDNAWGDRPERLLSAAILRIETGQIGLPLDARTEEGGTFDPFAPLSPLTLYATGVRNAFDLLWHSNGKLYVPTNGSAAGGNTPGTASTLPSSCSTRRIDAAANGAYTGPQVPALNGVSTAQNDYLYRVEAGGYYGHPNPTRCEWVLNGGNPAVAGPGTIGDYPVGVEPDRNWRGAAFDFGAHYSPNGVIEYRGGGWSGWLRGKLLVIRYSAGDDIVALTPGGAQQNIVDSTTNIEGFTGFNDPLDLIEDRSTGNVYVSELGGLKITLLRPIGGGTPQPQDIGTAPNRLVFSDAVGGGPSAAKSVRVSNTGDAPLDVTQLQIVGADASQFQLQTAVGLPGSIAPGAFVDVPVAFNPSSEGAKGAALRIVSNDPNEAIADVPLRGLATPAAAEPSLQRILDAYEIPVDVGDADPATPALGNGALLGDEIAAQRLRKAGPGNVTVEPLAVFGQQGPGGTATGFGWRPAGLTSGGATVFEVPNGSAQTLEPETTGSLAFNPGAGALALTSSWPAHADRAVSTDDALNTFAGAIPHHARVYPLDDSAGAPVPNAYVVAFEAETAGFDYQDLVAIVRNVEPAASGSAGQLAVENLDTVPFDNRLVFSRLGQLPGPPSGYQVHDQVTLRLLNTGAGALRITGLPLTGPYQLVSPPALPATIAPSAHLELNVKFVADSGSLSPGTLTVESDDPAAGSKTIDLAGFWQPGDGEGEPTIEEIVGDVFGYQTTITSPGQSVNGSGALAAVGEEILSPYWRRADPSQPVTVTALASYRGTGTPTSIGWHQRGSATVSTLVTQDPNQVQTLLPRASGTNQLATASFAPGVDFGWKMDNEWSDNTLNDPTPDHGNGCTGACGHHIRFWPVRNRAGELVQNAFIAGMDYSGINYDYQDNVYLITNVAPAP
jgi:chitodextrinase